MTEFDLGSVEHVACVNGTDNESVLDAVINAVERAGKTTSVAPVGEVPEMDGVTLGVAIGGDGTFLEGIQAFAPHDVPMMAVSSGSLNFLSRVDRSDAAEAVRAALDADAEIIDRTLVSIDGGPLDATGINEVQVVPTPPETPTDRKIARIHVWVAGEYAGAYDGSGVAVATPTGSTGLAFSAGGPVHHPADADVLQVTPLHTHSAGVRPVIVDADKEVRIRPEHEVEVNVDGGRATAVIEPGTEIVATGADGFARIVRTPYDDSFFDSLVDGLGWSLRKVDDPGPGRR